MRAGEQAGEPPADPLPECVNDIGASVTAGVGGVRIDQVTAPFGWWPAQRTGPPSASTALRAAGRRPFGPLWTPSLRGPAGRAFAGRPVACPRRDARATTRLSVVEVSDVNRRTFARTRGLQGG